MTNDTNRIRALDGVRGFAILLVLFWHYIHCNLSLVPGSLLSRSLRLCAWTWGGVDLFFVLSGFLIGSILLTKSHCTNYYRPFFVRRAFRILPLYFLTLFMFFVLSQNSDSGGKRAEWLFGSAMPYWTYLVYVQNFAMAYLGIHGANWMGITWSLAIEEQFYLVIAPLVRNASKRGLALVCASAIFLAPLIRVACLELLKEGEVASYVLLCCRWDSLFIGVLTAMFLSNSRQKRLVERFRFSFVSTGLVMFSSVIILCAFGEGIGSWGMAAFGHSAIAITSSLLIVLCCSDSQNSFVRAFFGNSILVYLGSISYGIYLFHQPIAGLLFSYVFETAPRISNYREALLVLVSLFLTLLFAQCSFRYIEVPLIRLGKLFVYS